LKSDAITFHNPILIKKGGVYWRAPLMLAERGPLGGEIVSISSGEVKHEFYALYASELQVSGI
jgi:hypothetical protein